MEGPMNGGQRTKEGPREFRKFTASELYCPKCKRATPVREQLLLVLPKGNKYDYRCSVCGEPVGSRTDEEGDGITLVRP